MLFNIGSTSKDHQYQLHRIFLFQVRNKLFWDFLQILLLLTSKNSENTRLLLVLLSWKQVYETM